MGDNPLLSIITVSFNSLPGLIETNHSLALLEGLAVERLLIDGGSTDGTLEFLRGTSSRYQTVVSEPDRGIYDAMNKGLRLARGKYLWFLNCGDQVSSNLHPNELTDRLQSEKAVWVGNLSLGDGGEARVTKDHFRSQTFVRHALPHQGALIPRDYFTSIGPYSEAYRLMADQEWFLRALTAGLPFRCLDSEVCRYAGGGISALAKNQNSIRREKARMLRRYAGALGATLMTAHVWCGEAWLAGKRTIRSLVRRRPPAC